MLKKFAFTLVLLWLLFSLSGCVTIRSKVKPLHTISIDATKINENKYAEVTRGIRLEIFFFKKQSLKSVDSAPINKLLQQIIKNPINVNVQGYQVYRFAPKSILTDQIDIQRSASFACFVVWCNETIMHMQILPWSSTSFSAIHIQFIGDDMYIQYNS